MNDRPDLSPNVTELIVYIRSLPDFEIIETIDGDYSHMGATITDTVLQSGLRYETVVRPRVQHVLAAYPQARTTSAFLELLRKEGPERVLQWKHPEKPNRVLAMVEFFQAEGIELEANLRYWLLHEENIARLKKLHGVGNKTADYLKILVGLPASAIDRHLFNFLADAGIVVKTYTEAQEIIDTTADQLGVNRSLFDHSIWKYMSTRNRLPEEKDPCRPTNPTPISSPN